MNGRWPASAAEEMKLSEASYKNWLDHSNDGFNQSKVPVKQHHNLDNRNNPHLGLLVVIVEVINEMRLQYLSIELRILSWQRTETDDSIFDIVTLQLLSQFQSKMIDSDVCLLNNQCVELLRTLLLDILCDLS